MLEPLPYVTIAGASRTAPSNVVINPIRATTARRRGGTRHAKNMNSNDQTKKCHPPMRIMAAKVAAHAVTFRNDSSPRDVRIAATSVQGSRKYAAHGRWPTDR